MSAIINVSKTWDGWYFYSFDIFYTEIKTPSRAELNAHPN